MISSSLRLRKFILIALAVVIASCAGATPAEIRVQDQKSGGLIREGLRLYERGNYESALEKLTEAEGRSASAEDKRKIAEILSAGGLGLSTKYNYGAALEYFRNALRINKSVGANAPAAVSLSYIGKIHSDIGKFEEALFYFEEALRIQESEGDKSAAVHNLNNAANLLAYLGRYDEAVSTLEKALSISEAIENPEQTAKTLINLGMIYHNRRNYKKSIETLKAAFDASNAALDSSLAADALSLTGAVYRKQGKFPDALDNYRRALEINELQGDGAKTAHTLTNIGEAHLGMDNYNEAIANFTKSLEIGEKIGNKLVKAVSLNYLGEAKLKQGNLNEANRLFIESEALFAEIGYRHGIARALNNTGFVKTAEKNWSGAAENFDRAAQIFKQIGDREWAGISLLGKGAASEGGGDVAAALESYGEAVDALESVREDVAGGSDARSYFTEVNIKVYEKLVALLIKEGKKDEALRYIERSRSKTLRDAFLESGIDALDERTRGLVGKFDSLSRRDASLNAELVKERLKNAPSLEKIDNISKTLADTRAEFRAVSRQLKSEFPKIYDLLSINPGTFLALEKRQIPPKTAFVEYFVTDSDTYVFVLSNGNLTLKQVSVSKEELNSLVALFRATIHKSRFAPAGKDGGGVKELSRRLYGYLIEPLEEELQGADTVAVIPFGSLHYLPFHALGREDGGGRFKFLIEDKRVVYLVSASANYMDLILSAPQGDRMESVAAFGNPDLGEPDLVLPYSEEEVLSIKKEFPNASVFIKREATKANFKQSWGKHEIIHLAAHGLIQGEPSILLAPLGAGSLTLSDIAGLPSAAETKLVVLSACEAAIDDGEENPTGAELNSIALAFGLAGAPSVIATLWRVDDRATFEIMADFYRNLKSRRDFSYDALWKAQRGMLKRTDKYGQPFYWAPFVLLGSWK